MLHILSTVIYIRLNTKYSKTRVVIEQAFGLLDSRFRRVIYMETRRLDIAATLVLSACVLHNACIHWGDEYTGIIYSFADIEDEATTFRDHAVKQKEGGLQKSDAIMKAL